MESRLRLLSQGGNLGSGSCGTRVRAVLDGRCRYAFALEGVRPRRLLARLRPRTAIASAMALARFVGSRSRRAELWFRPEASKSSEPLLPETARIPPRAVSQDATGTAPDPAVYFAISSCRPTDRRRPFRPVVGSGRVNNEWADVLTDTDAPSTKGKVNEALWRT